MAQSKGIVSFKFPYVPIHVEVNKNGHDLTALIDTGFDGEVALPAMLVSNGELPRRFITCKLADNSIVEVPAYIGSIKVGNKLFKDIVVLVMGDEPVIGRGIISHFTITLDHGKKITLKS